MAWTGDAVLELSLLGTVSGFLCNPAFENAMTVGLVRLRTDDLGTMEPLFSEQRPPRVEPLIIGESKTMSRVEVLIPTTVPLVAMATLPLFWT